MIVAITGAGSGIGQGLARAFRADGDSVVGCDLPHMLDGAREVCDLAVACDVTDREQVQAFVDAAVEKFGRLDALIANAGLGRRELIEEADWESLEEVVRVNLFGVVHCVRAALPYMRKQDHGRIVVLTSRNAELCPPKLAGYNMSKAGVTAFVRTLSRELTGTDILANNLIPGPTLTEMNPRGTRAPDSCYPTARMLATLPAGGPSGKTFFDEQEYPMFDLFVRDIRRVDG